MASKFDPRVGDWYQHLDKGQEFEVVAVDEDQGLVEIQHFDGDVEEMDLETWYQLELEPIEPPEDWTGPVDNVDLDDLGYDETDMHGDDWGEPYREIKPVPRPRKKSYGDEEEWDESEYTDESGDEED